MSSKFSLLANAMPTFTKQTTVEKKVEALTDYQIQLLEYLRYALSNLDADNFNPTGLNEILAPVVAEIKNTDGDILTLWATAEELAAQIEDVDGNYTSLKATVTGLQSTVSSHTNSINNQAATNTSLQSQITQTANKISAVVSAVDDSSGNVTAASIVAAINSAGSTVKISADHIQLSGDFVTISDLAGNGTVEINAGNIAAGGTISGCVLETRDGGYARMTIDTDTIDFGDIAMIGLSTSNDLGVFADKGKLELYGRSGVKIYTADGGDYYWTFHSWGIAVWDANTDEVIGDIEATIY